MYNLRASRADVKGVRLACTTCILIGRLADELGVRPKLLTDLITAGKLAVHDHGIATITKGAADDLRWVLAQHRAEEEEAA
jgi:hypothetical protein